MDEFASKGRQRRAIYRFPTLLSLMFILTALSVMESNAQEKRAMLRHIDTNGFHSVNGDRFWSRPLYGPNRRCFVPTGELPHAAFVWFHPQGRTAYVRCGHFLPGVITQRGVKWLYQADQITATYDPGMMRFSVKDPVLDGDLRMEVVPFVPGDGYVVRVSSGSAVEFVFAFGGFWCLGENDKDSHQGNSNAPGGIIAEHYRENEFSTQFHYAVADGIHRVLFGSPLHPWRASPGPPDLQRRFAFARPPS